jgi:hypothetical protein
MLKPICVKCQRFYRMKKSGFSFMEGMPLDNSTPAGTENPDAWTPYKLWSGDLWECRGCGHQLISGVGSSPISEHYKPDFQEVVKRYIATYQVNDC